MNHDHKEKRHMHWTPVLVILAVALFSSRGLIRYLNFYNTFPSPVGIVNPIHMNLLASVLLSSFALSCLEILWMSNLIMHGLSNMEFPFPGMRFNIQLNCGRRHKHHKEFEESVVELNPFDKAESNVNMRSTPLVGLRQKINNYGI
jgi:hypothetical protein